jgi:hypothetical protein
MPWSKLSEIGQFATGMGVARRERQLAPQLDLLGGVGPVTALLVQHVGHVGRDQQRLRLACLHVNCDGVTVSSGPRCSRARIK